MLTVTQLSYLLPNKDTLFADLNFSLTAGSKAALVGNNGTGKSTLLGILSGRTTPSSGLVQASSTPYLIPQHFGQYNDLTLAQALGIDGKLKALEHILKGSVAENDYETLGDDWDIEEKCKEALYAWGLHPKSLYQSFSKLSGGEKTKAFLAGIAIHNPEIILMDEPSNHLDIGGRKILYDFILASTKSILVVSHDRSLLNLLHHTLELSEKGIRQYGCNYDGYMEQKEIEMASLEASIQNRQASLKRAKRTEREAMERKQRQDARGKRKQEKAGMPKIVQNQLKDHAEKSSSKLKDTHAEKITGLTTELSTLRQQRAGAVNIKLDVEDSMLHGGKVLVSAQAINHSLGGKPLWEKPLDIEIRSGERIHVAGRNGSGKTTLLRILLGQIQPSDGKLRAATFSAIYLDQDYSLLGNGSVYEQAEKYNAQGLEEHEVKIRLNRFLFGKETWAKPCGALSGGERMRLTLCCFMLSDQSPDLFVLDEPTNNLDIQNIGILTQALNTYKGTLLVVSHDAYFLKEIQVSRSLDLDKLSG